MRILIAEDDLTSRLMLQAVLGKFGCDATIAKDGEEAWKILQQPDAPKLVVLDRIMPGMDGSPFAGTCVISTIPNPSTFFS